MADLLGGAARGFLGGQVQAQQLKEKQKRETEGNKFRQQQYELALRKQQFDEEQTKGEEGRNIRKMAFETLARLDEQEVKDVDKTQALKNNAASWQRYQDFRQAWRKLSMMDNPTRADLDLAMTHHPAGPEALQQQPQEINRETRPAWTNVTTPEEYLQGNRATQPGRELAGLVDNLRREEAPPPSMVLQGETNSLAGFSPGYVARVGADEARAFASRASGVKSGLQSQEIAAGLPFAGDIARTRAEQQDASAGWLRGQTKELPNKGARADRGLDIQENHYKATERIQTTANNIRSLMVEVAQANAVTARMSAEDTAAYHEAQVSKINHEMERMAGELTPEKKAQLHALGPLFVQNDAGGVSAIPEKMEIAEGILGLQPGFFPRTVTASYGIQTNPNAKGGIVTPGQAGYVKPGQASAPSMVPQAQTPNLAPAPPARVAPGAPTAPPVLPPGDMSAAQLEAQFRSRQGEFRDTGSALYRPGPRKAPTAKPQAQAKPKAQPKPKAQAKTTTDHWGSEVKKDAPKAQSTAPKFDHGKMSEAALKKRREDLKKKVGK